MNRPPTSAYIHVPFCEHRCGYCDFALITGRDDLVPLYLAALAQELASLSAPRLVRTLYIGGGTPSQLNSDQLVEFFRIVDEWLPRAATCEFTIEVNPGDVTAEQVEVLSAAGINRVSLGTQSFHEAKLRTLDRAHVVADNYRAIELLQQRFAKLSLDLIFAAPGESPRLWQTDLDTAVQQQVGHLSTYGLTYEKGTRFWTDRHRGKLVEADDETQRTMFAHAVSRLSEAGFEHYEVSSFARPGHRSQHNQVYWRGAPYLGFGPGAASYIDGVRTVNHRSTTTYFKRLRSGGSPVCERERLEAPDAIRELLVLGLRMREGIDLDDFEQHWGVDPRQICGGTIDEFVEQGWLQLAGTRLRVTDQGLFLLDAIFSRLLSRY